jgi:acylphosphatase
MNETDERTIELFVTGRVQRVGYRNFSQRCAIKCSISGWTQNLPDGRVHIIAKGQASDIDAFIELLWAVGDPVIRVSHIDVHPAQVDISPGFFINSSKPPAEEMQAKVDLIIEYLREVTKSQQKMIQKIEELTEELIKLRK